MYRYSVIFISQRIICSKPKGSHSSFCPLSHQSASNAPLPCQSSWTCCSVNGRCGADRSEYFGRSGTTMKLETQEQLATALTLRDRGCGVLTVPGLKLCHGVPKLRHTSRENPPAK